MDQSNDASSYTPRDVELDDDDDGSHGDLDSELILMEEPDEGKAYYDSNIEDSSFEPSHSLVEEDDLLVQYDVPMLKQPTEEPGSRMVLVKLPPSIRFVHEEFQAERFQLTDVAEFEDEDEEVVTCRIDGTVRWKKSEDGCISNAHLVQWTNDSWSLCIGGNEIFDVSVHDHMDENLFIYRPLQDALLEEVERMTERFMIRNFPYDASSGGGGGSTNIGKWSKLATSSTMSESKVKMAVTSNDPEGQKVMMERALKEKMKLRVKTESKRKALAQQQLNRLYQSGMTKEWLENDDDQEEEEEETKNNKHRGSKSRYSRENSDEDKEDDEDDDEDYQEEQDDDLNNDSENESQEDIMEEESDIPMTPKKPALVASKTRSAEKERVDDDSSPSSDHITKNKSVASIFDTDSESE